MHIQVALSLKGRPAQHPVSAHGHCQTLAAPQACRVGARSPGPRGMTEVTEAAAGALSPSPKWPARLPQRQARWSRCGLRDSGPLCCGRGRGRQRSSIKLKVPHLNSNRKGRSRGLPRAGLPAPVTAGWGPARRGTWEGGLSPGDSARAFGGFSRTHVDCATCRRRRGKLPWSEA